MGDEVRTVVVAVISGVFGVKGWLRLRSYTDPPENVFGYTIWKLQGHKTDVQLNLVEGRQHGNGLLAKLESIDDRDQAQDFVGSFVVVNRKDLPPVPHNVYYWADLIGLAVITKQGTGLGAVTNLMETGSNDVLVVRGDRERLIPFILGQVVVDVDIKGSKLVVDWDPEF